MTLDVAIDPGTRNLGWAASYEGAIVACGVSRLGEPPREGRDDLAVWASYHAASIALTLGGRLGALQRRTHVESMRWRPNDARSQPNDLLDVQTVGVLVGALLSPGHAPHLYPAQVWKKNLPKAVMHNRLDLVLSPDERAIVQAAIARAPKANAKEILDAVGLSVYVSGRVDDSGRRRER